ncbi:MAG: hypothetical protein MJ001_08265, partial [Paludibacteraceae bacterium]|nr:hypothetical protein [Paludibacteraceae bacterium]
VKKQIFKYACAKFIAPLVKSDQKETSKTLMLVISFLHHRNGWLSYLMPIASKISQKRVNDEFSMSWSCAIKHIYILFIRTQEDRIFNMSAMPIIWVS